jgi:hypothetical protein
MKERAPALQARKRWKRKLKRLGRIARLLKAKARRPIDDERAWMDS